MSYEPTSWKDGDLVTSAKLNKLEQGVASSGGGGSLMVHGTISENAITLDKTWKEIYDAAQQEKYVGIIMHPVETAVMNFPAIGVGSMGSRFIVQVIYYDEVLFLMTYETDSEDGYPTYVIDNKHF